MFNLFLTRFNALLSLFRSRRNLLLENLTLRQQLAVDTRRAPSWILPYHPKDEIPDFLRNPSATDHPGALEMPRQ